MLHDLGERQQALLKMLLQNKQGMTMDSIGDALKITRTAVRQHLWTLERNGYVKKGDLQATGGRPVQVYQLTHKGYDLFPKQYSWFSEVLLEAILKEKGPEGFRSWLQELGQSISKTVENRIQSRSLPTRADEVVTLLNELAYEASISRSGKAPVIQATNCVFHSLASRFPEVCQFDIAILAKLTGAEPVQESCIMQGSDACRFRLEKCRGPGA
ncbi:MAG: HTH domain-containing protein [Oligoflexia bacterium]|nr:HTH domain-containing protein [Oligoflexia bacterium]